MAVAIATGLLEGDTVTWSGAKYGPSFDSETGNGRFEIWVPVKA